MFSRKVAVVTGSNKGIGYAIVKGLCEKFDGDVYLTSRDVKRGQASIKKLKSLGLNPLFHQLNITDQESVNTFKDYLKSKHGGIDVLVNNAGVAIESNAERELMKAVAKDTIYTNYYGTKRVCDALFPLLRQNGRVVNISSGLGHLSQLKSADLKDKFNDKKITIGELNDLMDSFLHDVADGKEDRWCEKFLMCYVVSKVGICCLSNIQQRLFEAETSNRNISVNSVHPGFIETDMTRELFKQYPGAASIEEGAKAPLFLALEANLKGKYVWSNCKVIDWDAPSLAEYA